MIPLPDEIYLYILQSLPNLAALTHRKEFEDYRQISTTLALMCRVSRVFRAFAEPLLYRAYIEDEEDFSWLKRGEAEVYTRLQLLLRTLISRPNLAAKVEYLRLADCIDPPNIKQYCPLGDLFIKASRQISAFYKSLPLDKARLHRDFVWQSDWQHGLRRRGIYPDAEVALLLALCPNLGNLDMYVSDRNIGCFVGLLFHGVVDAGSWREEIQNEDGQQIRVFKAAQVSSTIKLPFFSRLRVLTLSGGEELEDFEWLKDIACISSLKSLCIHDAFMSFEGEASFRLPLEHILDLALKDCWILDIHMRSIVRSCGSLRSLRIKLPSRMALDPIDFNLDALLKCLVSSSETLEELQICMPKTSPELDDIEQADIFDLRSFTRLRTIEINMELLFNPTSDSEPSFAALLPTSIDDLYLRMADKKFAKHLQVLAEEYKGLPNLKTVDIGVDNMPSIQAIDQTEMDWKLALNHCARTLKKGGVECNIPVEGTHFNLSFGLD